MNVSMRIMRIMRIELAGAALASLAQAQVVAERIEHRVLCASCRITATRIVTLGGVNDPVGADEAPYLSRDSRGRYFAIAEDRYAVVVYAPDGKYLTSFGRRGQGPGEVGGIGISRLRVGHGDSIYVLDTQRRLSVFSPSLAFARQTRIGANPSGSVILSDGGVVLSQYIRTPGEAGYPFHLIDRDGVVLRSFGTENPNIRPDQPGIIPPMLSLAKERAVWTSRSRDYRLEEWRLSGERGVVLQVVGAPWLPSRAPTTPVIAPPTSGGVRGLRASLERFAAVNDSARPTPALSIAGIDSLGRVWINGFAPIESPKGMVVKHLLEVVDPFRKRVIVSQPVESAFTFLDDGRIAYTISKNTDGVVSVSVWKLQLRGM